MASSPQVIGTPKTWQQALSSANTNRDGTGTLGTVVTAGSSGSRIDLLRAYAAGTVAAGVIRWFLSDGTHTRLYKEMIIAAVTPSTSQEVAYADYTIPGGLDLPNGWSLSAATNNAETWNVFAQGGDY